MLAAIIDTETTDLIRHPAAKLESQPKVIEFGGILIDHKGKVIARMSELIYPGSPIPLEATRINGISDSDVKGKPTFAKLFNEINKFISKADVAIAHNMPFDKGVLDFEAQRIGKALKWPENLLCTVQLNVPVYGYRVKLQDLYKIVTGKDYKQTHRALDDCELLAEIIIEESYLDVFLNPATSNKN